MQILVALSADFAARAAALGLTPEAYAHDLLAQDPSADALWQIEAIRRSAEIDEGRAELISWEKIESRLRSRIAG